MKHISLALVTSFTLAGAAMAQDTVVTQQSTDELLGGWVIGAGVTSATGERIGSIDDLIVTSEGGEITAAIVSVGGFLGFGAKSIAVDWSEFEISYDAREVVLNMSREAMEDAPEYTFRDRAEMPVPDGGVGGGVGTEPAAGGGLDLN